MFVVSLSEIGKLFGCAEHESPVTKNIHLDKTCRSTSSCWHSYSRREAAHGSTVSITLIEKLHVYLGWPPSNEWTAQGASHDPIPDGF